MKKKGLGLFLIIAVLASLHLFSSAEQKVKIEVNYHRFDAAYEGWNLWVWPENKEGKSFEFTEETAFGKKATFEVDASKSFGIIVRKGEWEAKDVEQDRFFDQAYQGADGVYRIYLVQDTDQIYKAESDVDLSPKILSANWVNTKALNVLFSAPIDKSDLNSGLRVNDEMGKALALSAVTTNSGDKGTRFFITTKEEMTMGRKYTLELPGFNGFVVDGSALFDTEAFEALYGYDGDLGAIYQKHQTTFKVWSPVADQMTLNLYKTGDGDSLIKQVPMAKKEKGVFEHIEMGDQHGIYYTFSVEMGGKILETYDPYAKGVGVNGDRSMVVDFNRLNPEGWGNNRGPKVDDMTDIVVYEMHIRDLTIHESSGAVHKGKYLGVIEPNTKTPNGIHTGLAHIKELGVTHVQILPMYDFNSIDETKLEKGVFNWGYDPKNYNAPEGSYATDPFDGSVRIKEMKQMIQGLQDNGIGVIMDVVYNHTALSADSNFHTLVPGYYYRMTEKGFSNASGCGNETASERMMMRKFIVDSLVFWVEEYHIDGFRFDLMGIHDIETMKLIESTLRKIKPDIILYGEGWTGGTSTLSETQRLVKKNMKEVVGIGAFNDDLRDGIKGHVFNDKEAGFANGFTALKESVKFGIVGATRHPQVQYKSVNYSVAPWAYAPYQSVNYVEAHDNLTLWDKLLKTNPDASEASRVAMHQLSSVIAMTSQGVPFMHLGMDFLRTKNGDHNSYISPDAINQIDWNRKETYLPVFHYYQGLVELRLAYPSFRLKSEEAVAQYLTFFEDTHEDVIAYVIAKGADPILNQSITVFFNGALEARSVQIPKGNYQVLLNEKEVNASGLKSLKGGQYTLAPSSALILLSQGEEEAQHLTLWILGLVALSLAIFVLWRVKKK